MSLKDNSPLKVGIFVLSVFCLLIVATLKISKGALFAGSRYPLYLLIDSANGISKKTPVLIAGIEVGEVSDIELMENNQARVTLAIQKKVHVSTKVEARVKTLGFLGDTYIELYQPGPLAQSLQSKDTITNVKSSSDLSAVTDQAGQIAEDIKAITTTLRKLMSGDDSTFSKSLNNIEKITASLEKVTTKNEQNLDAIIVHLRGVTENLNLLVARNMQNVDTTLGNFAEVSDKIKRGEGTIGRLINDDETVNKLNDSIDNLNELLGTGNRLKVDVGYHAEYLGNSSEFKHYVGLDLLPAPDKAFKLEFVSDPDPSPIRRETETTVTAGGVTSTVLEKAKISEPTKFLISAQLAKKFRDFTFRGGVIESSGGIGIDYGKGPVGVEVSAFDFGNSDEQNPHLKAMGTVNVTKTFFLLGGVDDFVSKTQDPDWFMGAGLKVTDDDIKSLFGLMSLR